MYLATVPGCCTKKAVGYAIGATACGADSVVRGDRYGGPQVPDEEREDDPPPPGRGSQYTSEQFARHLKGYGIHPSVGRTGVCWAGAWAEVGGCHPSRNERVYQMVHHRKKQGHPGYCLPGQARYTRSETTPLRPGVQDAGRGRPGAPSSKTSSLKDRFQGCPRHARQPTDPRASPLATRNVCCCACVARPAGRTRCEWWTWELQGNSRKTREISSTG